MLRTESGGTSMFDTKNFTAGASSAARSIQVICSSTAAKSVSSFAPV
jgi:hypothetical protein